MECCIIGRNPESRNEYLRAQMRPVGIVAGKQVLECPVCGKVRALSQDPGKIRSPKFAPTLPNGQPVKARRWGAPRKASAPVEVAKPSRHCEVCGGKTRKAGALNGRELFRCTVCGTENLVSGKPRSKKRKVTARPKRANR
jgi:hypothetical protein